MRQHSSRASVTLLALLGVSVTLLRLAWLPGAGFADLPHALATTSPDRSLPCVLALALTGFTLWLAVTVLAALASDAPGVVGRYARAALHRLAPAAVQRTLAMTLGLTVLTSTAGVAQAAGPTSHVAVTQSASAPSLTLDWPAASAPTPAIDLDRPALIAHHDPGRGLSLVTSVPRRVPAAQAIPAEAHHRPTW